MTDSRAKGGRFSGWLRPGLLAKANGNDSAEILRILNSSYRFNDRVHSRLIRSCRPELVKWISKAEPLVIARFIQLADAEFGNELGDLVRALCRGLSTVVANPAELRSALRIINQYRHLAEADDGLREVISGLRDGGLELMLQITASPDAQLGVLRELERFHHPDLARLVLRQLPHALNGVRSDRPDDYITVRRAKDLQWQVWEELKADDMAVPEPVGLDGIPGVAAMLDRTPRRGDGVALFINALILRLSFGVEETDWDVILSRYQTTLRNALAHSPLGEMARAFRNLADYHRGLCVRLLNQRELSLSLGKQLESSSPVEVAILLRTVKKLHGKFAKELLYDRNGRPKLALAHILARKIKKLGDGKGAGLLLSAAASVDDVYGSRSDGFAHLVAKYLSVEFAKALLETDHRPSIVSHFIRGLWEASAEYLPEVTEQAEHVAVQAVIGSARAWGPRLALLLGASTHDGENFIDAHGGNTGYGERFLSSLAERIDLGTLLDRMVTAEHADAFIAHHQLGRALYPDLPARFQKDFDSVTIFQRVVLGRPEVVARCCAAVADTLVSAGMPDAGAVALAKPCWDWPTQLRRSHTPGDLAESLRLLHRMDPDAARDAVENLSEAKSEYRRDRGFLEHQLHRTLVTPAAAAELLAAVEAAAPGRGAALLHRLVGASGAWHAFGLEVAHDQDPREQSTVLRQLVKLGLRPGQPGTAWLESLYQKWLTTLPGIRSPHAIADLLRTFTALDQSWGTDLAERVALVPAEPGGAAGAAPPVHGHQPAGRLGQRLVEHDAARAPAVQPAHHRSARQSPARSASGRHRSRRPQRAPRHRPGARARLVREPSAPAPASGMRSGEPGAAAPGMVGGWPCAAPARVRRRLRPFALGWSMVARARRRRADPQCGRRSRHASRPHTHQCCHRSPRRLGGRGSRPSSWSNRHLR